MVKRKIEKIKGRMQQLQKKLKSVGPLMRGTIVYIGTRNKQYYFSLNKNKRTKLIYLGNKRVKQAKEYSDNYKKLVDIIEEMTTINMELLKKNIPS